MWIPIFPLHGLIKFLHPKPMMNCLMAKDPANLIHGGHPDMGGNGSSRGSIFVAVITNYQGKLIHDVFYESFVWGWLVSGLSKEPLSP